MLVHISSAKKFKSVLLVLVFTTSLGKVTTETNEISKIVEKNKTAIVTPEQKSVKKDLKLNITDDKIVLITPPNGKGDHTERLVIIDEKSVMEAADKSLDQQSVHKDSENTAIKPQHYQHHPVDGEFVLNNEDDISDSLKTGFFFFLILSSGAIVFIIFKIYRLRLSRAERKYGVQGDRSTQELTPLPISIEDGHSDDEDQTLFEVQRQNIRIL